MYNLIITMISIALIGVTGLVAISYTGVIFSVRGGEGSARAHVVTLLNNAQQVAGAQRVYQAYHAGNLVRTYQTLIDEGYLRAVPETPTGAVIGGWSMSPDGVVSMIPLSVDRDGQTGSPAERICELLPVFGGSALVVGSGLSPITSDLDASGSWFACVTNPTATSVSDATGVWFVHRT